MANASEHVIKFRAEMEGTVTVRPGDTLVIGVGRRLSMAEADDMRRRLEEQLPGVTGVIIDDCTGLAVQRPAEARKLSYGVSESMVAAKAEQLGITPEELIQRGKWPR